MTKRTCRIIDGYNCYDSSNNINQLKPNLYQQNRQPLEFSFPRCDLGKMC